MFTERRESVGPTNPNLCSTFVGETSNMEEYGLESFEDPSDINEDVVEISVENSVEANLLCMKS